MTICLVCNEILGTRRSFGGIGTATSHLALLLARSGHSVTIFYVGDAALDPGGLWASHYLRANVAAWHVPVPPEQVQPAWMRQPVDVYERLQYQGFEIILFQDWKALGHACMVAKRAGLAFLNTTLSVITHSSISWILEANHSFPKSRAELALIHMEQQAVELADSVVSPSYYLVEWMRKAGWTLPENTSVVPYFLNATDSVQSLDLPLDPAPKKVSQPPHLIFYGRLEERKGIGIFLSAVTSDELRPFQFKLTFLGAAGNRTPEYIRGLIGERRPDLLLDLDFQTDLSCDEAQAFLLSTGGIPVMPSLTDNSPCVVYESLKLGVPFLASSGGGIPELIDSEDWDHCLFDPAPRPLARKLRQVLCGSSWNTPRPAFEQHEIAAKWLRWFGEQAPKQQPLPKVFFSVQTPDTTVIITHFERPHLVEQTLRTLALQSDRRFEVVLVDDGSQTEAAAAFLDRASRGIAGLTIHVVRQTNKYVGAARNEGLRHAARAFVIFLDDDNVPFPNMVEVFRRAIHTSGADIVTCQMQFLPDATGEPDLALLAGGERWAFPGGPLELGAIQNCFGDATAIYKRDAFERIGVFHEIAGVTHEDWQLHLRASLEGLCLLSLPLPLFWYRATPDSMTQTTDYSANMGVVASALRAKMPRNLSRMVDYMIGTNPGRVG